MHHVTRLCKKTLHGSMSPLGLSSWAVSFGGIAASVACLPASTMAIGIVGSKVASYGIFVLAVARAK